MKNIHSSYRRNKTPSKSPKIMRVRPKTPNKARIKPWKNLFSPYKIHKFRILHPAYTFLKIHCRENQQITKIERIFSKNNHKKIQILTNSTTFRWTVCDQKPHSKAQLAFPTTCREPSENHRGRTRETDNSRTRQDRIEVMKRKTKNQKLTEPEQKRKHPCRTPSLSHERSDSLFLLVV